MSDLACESEHEAATWFDWYPPPPVTSGKLPFHPTLHLVALALGLKNVGSISRLFLLGKQA